MSTESDNGDDKRRLLEALCQHIVSLTWVDVNTEARRVKTGKHEREPEALAISAFVISIRGIWFLVTAGHVIRQMESRLAYGRRIVTACLMDGFSTKTALPPIPFPLTETLHWHIDREGLDYALFPLRPLYAEGLKAGGVLALNEEAWDNAPDTADAYFLLGFPTDVTSTSVIEDTRQGHAVLRLGTPLLPLQPVEDLPDAMRYQPNRFFAHVPVFNSDDAEEKTVEDISGMSGGPVFAVQFTKTGGLRYWVVAVQSKWCKDSRIIAACPIQPLADAIAKSMAEHASELEGHGLPTKHPGKGA